MNAFDQFDSAAAASGVSSNPFDQFDRKSTGMLDSIKEGVGDLALKLNVGTTVGIPEFVQGVNDLAKKHGPLRVMENLILPDYMKNGAVQDKLANWRDSADEAIRGALSQRRENLSSELSPVQQAADKKTFFTDDMSWSNLAKDGISEVPGRAVDLVREGNAFGEGWGDWRKVTGAAAESAPETLATMGPVGKMAGTSAKLARAAELAKTGSAVAAEAAAKKAAERTAVVAGSLSEGIQGAGSANEQTRRSVMEIPIEKLRESPFFQQEVAANGGNEEAARIKAADAAASTSAAGAFAFDALFGAIGDKYIGTAAAGAGKRATSVARGVAQETPTEFVQSAGEKFSENLGVQRFADPNQALMQNVGEDAVAGGLSGGLMGGAMGGALHRNSGGVEPAPTSKLPDTGPLSRGANIALATPAAEVFGAPVAAATDAAVLAAEQAPQRQPAGLGAIDRVAEIAKEETRLQSRLSDLVSPENGYGPTFDGERSEIADQLRGLATEREAITSAWPSRIEGGKTSFSTENGDRIQATYALMSADQLNSSHDESLKPSSDYPQELQPRERARAASEMQVSGIAQRLDPARLGESADAATGAPIVGADGLVESGNARTIALKRVHRSGDAKSAEYKQFLRDNAERFGLKPEDVDAVANPVLVRVRETPVDRAEFARQANASTAAQMSPSEQANSDAARIDSLDDLTPTEDGDFMSSRDFIRRFVAKLATTEQAGMIDATGQLSQSGYARIRNAILAKAYGDSPVLARMVESMDDSLRNVVKALMTSAPAVAKLREDVRDGALFDADITPDLLAAVEELSRLRDAGKSVADELAQVGMFDSAVSTEARDLLRFLDENIRRPRKIAEFIQRYIEALRAAGNPNQGSLLGEAQAPAKSEIIESARENRNDQAAGRIERQQSAGAETGQQSEGSGGDIGGAGGNAFDGQPTAGKSPDVKTRIEDQLHAAGVFVPQVNEAYSAMIGDFYSVTADKLGVSSEALYERYPLSIGAGVAGDLQLGQQLTPDQLLAMFAEADTINIEAQGIAPMSDEESDRAQDAFLSTRPEGETFYERQSGLSRRIRRASQSAADELGNSAETTRRIDRPLGPFSGYLIQGEVVAADEFYNPGGRLKIKVFGKEQTEAGLIDEPALAFTVSSDGELQVNGPTPDGPTFNEFKALGWADYAKGREGEIAEGWSALQDPDRPGEKLPLAQLTPLLADVHARVREWRGEDRVGLHWSRATGALGGTYDLPAGFNGAAVFFQGGENSPGAYNEVRSVKRDDYTIDLFGVPGNARADSSAGKPAAGRQAGQLSRDDAPGTFATRTELVQENTRELGADRVNSPEEAAQALAYLARGAVERFDALVTDKGGKPLAIVGAFKGALTQASVFPSTVVGEAFRINGAANIWFAHNHPSGTNELSDADRRLHTNLAESFRGSGIKSRGIFAIAGKEDGGRNWVFQPTPESRYEEEPDIKGVAPTPKTTTSVPVVERVFSQEDRIGPPVTAPSVAKLLARSVSDGQSGVILLTARNETVAFVPIDPSEAGELRRDGRMDALYRALSVSNAGAAIIVNNGALQDDDVRNLAGLFNSLDTRVLDVLDTGDDVVRSWAERGLGFGGTTLKQGELGTFDPATFRVGILDGANLSTFLHESGHVFLEVQADLAERLMTEESQRELSPGERQIVADMQTTLDWFGIKDLADWQALDLEGKRDYHEQFARGFEAYLYEGNAPTPELEGLFARFSEWLRQVYRDLKALNVELSDEVRGVFDRMLSPAKQQVADLAAGSSSAMLSRGTGEGMAIRDLNAVVDRLSKGFKNLPKVNVLESPADLSTKSPTEKALRDFIRKSGAWDDVEGATHDGEIYLFASGLSDEARAEHVFAIHEVTHYGLRGAIGKDLDAALQHVWMHNPKVRKAAAALRDRNDVASNVEAVEEVLADMRLADLARLKGWRRMVKAVRDWLYRSGATRLAARLDNWIKAGLDDQARADLFVADMVTAARQWVRNGKGIVPTMQGTRLADGDTFGDASKKSTWLSSEAKYRGFKSVAEMEEKSARALSNLEAIWDSMRSPAESEPRLSRATPALTDEVPGAAERAEQILGKKVAAWRPLEFIVRKATTVVRFDRLTSTLFDRGARILDRYTPEQIKAGVIADYGIPEAVLDQRVLMQGRMKVQLRKAGELIDKLSTLTRAESRVAYEWMNNSDPQAAAYFEAQLPPDSVKTMEEVKTMVDKLSQEAVHLGQLDPEAFKRNRFEYLRRSYIKHTSELTKGEASSRKRAIAVFGDQYKGRGMSDAVEMSKIKNIAPEWWGRKLKDGKADAGLIGQQFVRLERRAPELNGTLPLESAQGPGNTNPQRRGKLLEVAYWPADQDIHPRYAGWDHAGTWEARDTRSGKLVLWRDFTKQERVAMGEIDEARYAIAKTLHGMVHDVETGRYLEWLSQRFAKKTADEVDGEIIDASERMRDVFKAGEWVKVPESKIPGTAVPKYGKLAGRYLPGPIWNDVRQSVGFRFKPLGETYAAILSAWKTSKTALSPAVHTNNIMANFVMADWHDVSAGHVLKSLRILLAASERDGKGAIGRVGNVAKRAGMADREAAKLILNRYEDSGGNLGTWATAELQKEQLEPLLAALEKEIGTVGESNGAQVGIMVALQHALRLQLPSAWDAFKPSATGRALSTEARSMIAIYEAEDQVFRLAAWLKAKEDGATDLDAGKAARRSFLDYNINAPWVQALRSTALPFIAFTYRAAPMMIEIAAKKPWKIIKLGLLAGAINALGYLASGGDEDEERRLLPEEKAGKIFGLVPKLIRMPWNSDLINDGKKVGESPVFLDIRRFIPVGDIFDTGATHSALPMLPFAMPGGPLSLISEITSNKSQFTGKEITLATDTATEKASKVADHLYKAFAPNLIALPGTYAWTGVMNAGSGKTDAFGREQSTAQAVSSAFGVKIGSYPTDVLELNAKRAAQAKTMEIDRNISQLRNEYQRNGITDNEFRERLDAQIAKRMRVTEDLQKQLRGE